MRKILILVACCLFASTINAQVSDKIIKVNVGTPKPSQPLTIQVDLRQSNLLDRIEIAYRQFGERDFKHSEMLLAGNSASITLPAEIILPPFLEYYFVLIVTGQSTTETYPVENPEQQPLKIYFQESPNKPYEFILLSPDKDENVSPTDLLISFSVTLNDSIIDMNAIKVFFDDIDLSKNIIRSGDLFVAKPDNASIFPQGGSHVIRIELYDNTGKLVEISTNNFSIAGTMEKKAPVKFSPWRYGVSTQLETRQENISSAVTPFNRATLSASGAYNEFSIHGNLYFTNEEKNYLQPQNRYFIGAESPWIKVGYGDSYPIYPDLIMNGKRIRGFTMSLTGGKFNFDLATGSIRRHIQSVVGSPFPDSNLIAEQNANTNNATFVLFDSTVAGKRWIKAYPGTFDRQLFVMRTGFGKRDETHLGFTYLKSIDDKNSILYGVKPEENVVFGSDFLLSIDRRNIELTAQAAFSATNKDITKGSFSDADINRVFPESTYSESERKNIRNIRNFFSKIITVNENLIPLAMKNMPTLSYECGISLNYFGNNFRYNYLRHGDSYESFGQSFLRTDVVGYNFYDRQRLLGNQIFLSGGYEMLKDNTTKIKPTTTTSTTMNVGISYYPRINFPNITIAYLLNDNYNTKPKADTLLAIDNQTNRVLIQIGKEFTLGVQQNAMFSISTSTKDDYAFRNLDTRNTMVSLSTISTFKIPLQTVLSITFNSNKFISARSTSTGLSSSLTYTTLYLNGLYRMSDDKLRLSASFSPTFGDIQRVLINAGAQYYFWNYLSAQTQLNLYFNQKMYNLTNSNTDIIWNLIIRADI